MTLADRAYRTEVGDELPDRLDGQRRQVERIWRGEDIHLGDSTGLSSRAMEVNALWAGSGQRRGPIPARW